MEKCTKEIHSLASPETVCMYDNTYHSSYKVLFSTKNCLYLSYFYVKTYVVGTH